MMFQTAQFIAFGCVVLALYWAVAGQARARLLVLFGASVAFYSVSDPLPLLVFGAYALLGWAACNLLDRLDAPGHRKAVLAVTVSLQLGGLLAHKYLDLFVRTANALTASWGLGWSWKPPGLLLPVGLSFVTFQAIAYTVDVYRDQAQGRLGLFRHALVLIYFPKLAQGPILRAKDLATQLDERPSVSPEAGAQALFRIAAGMAKKLLIADVLAVTLVDKVFGAPTQYTAAECLVAAVAYTFQLYFDFSGYTDIAIGVAALFGFKFPENFAKPYHATNLFEFWNRWHVTLSTWLRDYLYRPLGGSRGTRLQTLRNLMIVMTLGGLWHGADWRFAVWGGLHGLFLVLWRIWWWVGGKPDGKNPLRAAGGWFVAFAAVVLTRIVFRAESMAVAEVVFSRLLTLTPGVANVSRTAWLALGASVAFYFAPAPAFAFGQRLFVRMPALARAAALVGLGLLVRQLANVQTQPYIYFQF